MRTDSDFVARVRDKYNAIGDIWTSDDPWHAWSHHQIGAEMALVSAEHEHRYGLTGLIIDVGSGGNSYLSTDVTTVDVDVAERRLIGRPMAVCCSAETLALRDGVADLVVCVGPVINYCSLEEVVDECARVMRIGADLVLHVELSNSFEFAGRSEWGRDVAYVSSFYKGEENYWVYSDAFIRRVLVQSGFTLRRTRYFHFVSSVVYRLTGDACRATRFARVDRWISWIPGVGALADSAIYVCHRAA